MRVVPVICIAIIVACDLAHAQPNRIDSIRTPPSSALREFWTNQRLNDAQPMPVPVIEPRALSPVNPEAPKSGVLRSGQAKEQSRSVARMSGNVATRPLYWAGRLVFNTDAGAMTCSAQFVAPGILITAAHCVQNDKTGQWFTNFIYQHQLNRDQARTFLTECTAAYRGWVSADNSRWTWDFAMIKLNGGTDLGHFGTEWGWWGNYNTAPKIGYPAAIENAKVIQVEFGQLITGWDPKIVGLKHGNPRNAEGSSGGAWVGRYETRGDDTTANRVISVTSHHMGEDRGTSFGPYWNDNLLQLMNYAKRGCR